MQCKCFDRHDAHLIRVSCLVCMCLFIALSKEREERKAQKHVYPSSLAWRVVVVVCCS